MFEVILITFGIGLGGVDKISEVSFGVGTDSVKFQGLDKAR